MKLFCAIAVLACLGGAALSQQCARITSYSSVAFDTINFVPSRAYYDVSGGYLYFKNNGNDGAQFFDFNKGVVYAKSADGTCVKYQTDDLKLQSLSVDELTAASKQIVSFTDISGVTRVGKALTNGNLLIKDLFTSQCYIYFVSYAFNDAIKWSYFFIVPQSLSSADIQTVTTARDAFEAYACTSGSI
ncbi:hypothetical protein RRG08_001957 [Elysia crispata]|uniref:Uncharacterized protein n=1 Tax=Elysia crispata TaxID=231223 RepID=A0AAE1ECM2_9GAST|nr:hypothetical protein RRG08_001957 [Elysia crispata]